MENKYAPHLTQSEILWSKLRQEIKIQIKTSIEKTQNNGNKNVRNKV